MNSNEKLLLVCIRHDLGFEKWKWWKYSCYWSFENHNETSHIQASTVLFENVQGGENVFTDKDSRKDEQFAIFPFENENFEIIKQEAVLEAICPFLFYWSTRIDLL